MKSRNNQFITYKTNNSFIYKIQQQSYLYFSDIIGNIFKDEIYFQNKLSSNQDVTLNFRTTSSYLYTYTNNLICKNLTLNFDSYYHGIEEYEMDKIKILFSNCIIENLCLTICNLTLKNCYIKNSTFIHCFDYDISLNTTFENCNFTSVQHNLPDYYPDCTFIDCDFYIYD